MSKHTQRSPRKPALRAAAFGLLTGALVAGGASAATAVDSAWKNFTSNTVGYRSQASMFSNNNALTTLQILDHGAAPVGRMGGRARAYWSSGTLCSASATHYNTAATTIFTVEFYSNCGGYVYSQGQTQTWNGTGYDVEPTKRTSNLGPF